eukprot:g21761.t1
MVAFIAQSFEDKSWDVMLSLYRTLVRPLLEYCVQFRSSSYRKDIIKLEWAQKRFTRMLLGMEALSFKERLDRLGRFSLEIQLSRKYISYHQEKFGYKETNTEFIQGYIEKLGEAGIQYNKFDVL